MLDKDFHLNKNQHLGNGYSISSNKSFRALNIKISLDIFSLDRGISVNLMNK